jgi:hypothetical protein
MSIVYVLGAGASLGDVLHQLPDGPCVRLVGKDRPLPMPSFRSQMLGLATFERNVSTSLSIFVADEPGMF